MGLFGGGGDEDRGPRDARERERARYEREARRAARQGKPPPPLPPLLAAEQAAAAQAPVEPPSPPVVAEPRAAPPAVAGPPVPATPEPPAAPAQAPSPPAVPAGPVSWDRPGDPLWEEPSRAAPQGDAVRAHTTPRDRDTSSFEAGFHTGEHDVPVGVRKVASPIVTPPEAVARPAKARRVAPGVRAVPRSRRGARRILPLLVLVILGAAAWFYISLQQPFAGDGKGEGAVKVRIAGGLSADQIGDLLEAEGVVDSGFFFGLRARLSGERDNLRAGTFTLAKGMSYAAALEALTTPPVAARTINVTVPEGRSRRETLPIIQDSGLRGDYLRATTRREGFSPRRLYDAPSGVRDLEGFLFPATYELRKNATVGALVDKQLAAFQEAFAKLDLRAARRKNLTAYDVLIIASMVEREAALDRERPLIAAVIYNRLSQGIPLGIDATIRFRLNQWTQPLKVSELNVKSDYNTRTRQGLPPGPIGNPGVKSLQAAARPAKSRALYYVVKPCGEGAHAFSSTDAEFQADVAAYNRARDARGGKDPSNCP